MLQLRKSVSGGIKDSQKMKTSFFDCFYVMPPLKNGGHYITIFLAYLYYSMLKHNNPDQQKLQEMDQHIAETKQQNEQILEQTAAIPYLIDQETKEFYRDQQRLTAARIAFKFSEREIKIIDYHDKGYTQEMIADKFGNSVRTIQRDAARINKIYTDRGLPKRLLWNNRKKLD